MQDYEQHKKGIIGTVIFHLSVLVLLIFSGFFTPLPAGEGGILVNFGTSDDGFGIIEPGPAPTQNNREPVQIQREAVPIPSRTTTPPASTARRETAREAVITQNQEQTAAINAAENARREEQRQAEIAEAERLRRERENEQRINEINSRTQSAFNNNGTASGSGGGGQGSGTGTSQGVTFPGGTQGVPTGVPNAGNYGPGGSGSGNQGTGASFSLAGRSAQSLPLPNYPGNDDGVVVVRITVDRNGNVTAAEPGAQGTTLMNRQYWTETQQAALKAKFSVNENATVQQGTITYRFTLR